MLVFLFALCFASTGAQELTLPPGFDPTVFMDAVYGDIKAACPSGIEKCECMNAPGVFTKGPFDPRANPIGSLLTYAGCSPGYCFCTDAPEKEVDARPQVFKIVHDLCPRGEINRCLCHDGKTKVTGPLDVVQIFTCRPKKCKCNGSKKVMVNQGMGCKKGGYADCPKWHNLFCKDGTNIGNPTESMKWRLTTSEERRRPGFKGCACADGIMPRCKGTGKPIICPDGDEVDWNGPEVMEELAGCRMEEW